MATRYSIEQHFAFGEGIYRVTSQDDPDFPEGGLWDAQNMVYNLESDNPEVMHGSTRIGSTAMGGSVIGLFDYDNGTKLIACCDDGKIYQYGTDWAQCTGGSGFSTAGALWSATMFYGATTVDNLLVLTNGVDTPLVYSTSTGIDALTGGCPSTGNFATAHRGRVWMVGGEKKETLFYSAVNNCEDWTIAGGGGSVLIYRGYDGPITGLASYGESLFIFKRGSTYRIPEVSTISELSVAKVADSFGCVSHATIEEVTTGNNTALTFFSEHGIEAIIPSNVSTGFQPQQISRWIKPLIDMRYITGMGSAWSVWNVDRKELYSFVPIGTSNVPKMGLIANFGRVGKPPRWTRTFYPNLTFGCLFNSGNTTYDQYVGTSGGQVHLLHASTVETWNSAQFTGRAITRVYNQRRPDRMKRYGWVYVAADKVTSEDVWVRPDLVRYSLPTYVGNRELYTIGEEAGWGVGTWGVAPWGGLGYVGQRIRPQAAGRGSGLRFMIDSLGWFRLSGLSIASVLGAESTAA